MTSKTITHADILAGYEDALQRLRSKRRSREGDEQESGLRKAITALEHMGYAFTRYDEAPPAFSFETQEGEMI